VGEPSPNASPGDPDPIGTGPADGVPTDDVPPSHLTVLKRRIVERLHRYEDVPVVGLGSGLVRRDSESGGSMIGSAIAFRLFVFFIPLLLLIVGLAGFLGDHVDPRTVDREAGISGGLATQIQQAFHQSDRGPWVITLLGLLGIISTGRALSRVLQSASCQAWDLPLEQRSPVRVVGAIAGLVGCMGLVAILVSRARADLGAGVASVSFLPAFIIYGVAWLVISALLPHGTEDPGALLPGALFVAGVLTGMHAVSELYLPSQFTHASELYGAMGATIVTLGWFFFLGRAVVIGMELNPVIYERYGSVSTLFFSLPVLRLIPRRSARIRRIFDLEPPA
jgi:uncharacterized BrkB/YihY/UPF0761 family membrane protein